MEDSVFQMQQAAKQRVHRAREQARRIVEENNRRCAVPTAYSRPLRYSEEREAVCRDARVDMINVPNGGDVLKPVIEFFTRRRKRSKRV